jgi:hypothetical protein
MFCKQGSVHAANGQDDGQRTIPLAGQGVGKLTGNARSVEVGSPNSPEVLLWEVSRHFPYAGFWPTSRWQTTDPLLLVGFGAVFSP